MKDRKPILIRLPQGLFSELEDWAKQELRSISRQIEYILAEALRAHQDNPNGDGE